MVLSMGEDGVPRLELEDFLEAEYALLIGIYPPLPPFPPPPPTIGCWLIETPPMEAASNLSSATIMEFVLAGNLGRTLNMVLLFKMRSEST